MKIRPVILCGGAGTRLWQNKKNYQPKQFIDFGGWTLLEKTFKRIKDPLFDSPIISTNSKYLLQVLKYLKKSKIRKYKIILEPSKKNTGPAILSSALINDIPFKQSLIFFSADHLIEKSNILNRSILENQKYLNNKNIFIFGIKPKAASNEYGYFLSKKVKNNLQKVVKFIEKPNTSKAKKIIKQKGYWNSGIFFLRKDSIINNFKRYQSKTFMNCVKAVNNANHKRNIYYLNKKYFDQTISKSFDYAILEKAKDINAIKLDIPWSDLGSWKEILRMYSNSLKKYFKLKNVHIRPWGKYVNLFRGKEFLIKQLYVKPKGILSLQKHFYRSEHWLITQGNAKITLNNEIIIKKPNDYMFIPIKTIHRVQNSGKKPVKIMEAQIGSILKETDIVRYEDFYGRIKHN